MNDIGVVEGLTTTVRGGAPVTAEATGENLERSLLYGHHLSATGHLQQFEKTIGIDIYEVRLVLDWPCGGVSGEPAGKGARLTTFGPADK